MSQSNASIKGFTLIEVMVTLVIIAIMAGVISLNINSPSYSTFMANANKVATLLSLLADEAAYSGSVIKCKVNYTGLKCSKYKNQTWKDLPLSNVVSWTWPDRVHVLQISVDGVFLKDEQREIKFYPTGNRSIISLQIGDYSYTTWITTRLQGGFSISN